MELWGSERGRLGGTTPGPCPEKGWTTLKIPSSLTLPPLVSSCVACATLGEVGATIVLILTVPANVVAIFQRSKSPAGSCYSDSAVAVSVCKMVGHIADLPYKDKGWLTQ